MTGAPLPVWLVWSAAGIRRLAVPVAACPWCEQVLPVDHDCPVLRALIVLAANTIHPRPALAAVRDHIEDSR